MGVTLIDRICPTCNEGFKAALGEVNKGRGIYCSKSCRPPWNKGLKGRQPWMDISGLSPSPATQFKKGSLGFNRKHSQETKIKLSMLQQGIADKNDWQGFKTGENKSERHKFQRTVQSEVFKRDDYTCQVCIKKGGSLQVDHIKSWSEYPELRFNMENCRTLCMACHYYVTFKRKLPEGVIWGHNLSRGIT